ncbi:MULTISPECIES: cyclopropane-fatty-acyl-phospholipid synthase family protein [unclassified Caballeronia]|jgi:cyclopropane-fatty-acyl-phospholipid synthase|uniref:SAM-dependent methyltransferase n=1 Tax=unclassified Caballeronia TaxID=2646786 RepID=UPI0020293E24|nr:MULTISPECIES: cyclopropane-fatty-acyl-phospholipid synthase family protein [unclassified Caballeronia]MDR5795535.1 cyclopropane-fatty-acyl-phospholipid synthase [Caballeronia sp. LZ008]
MNITARDTSSAPAAPADMPALDESRIIRACERGLVPDALVRAGMRLLIRQRLIDEYANDNAQRTQAFERFLNELRASPIAIDTHAANAQHYELPDAFFEAHLGPRLKYSCGLYPRGDETLAQAELAMLERYAERAQLADGQRILDLGCGWGSLALWMAERYPRAQIVALSNSGGQRAFIEARARQRGLRNLRVVTGDVVDFDFAHDETPFDRILSIEMFEHMKHYGLLLAKIARWLADDGRLFVHHFAHATLAYHFTSRDGGDWMSRYFFTGGTMPSASLLLHFQDDLRVTRQWWMNGTHYARTANQWLANLDAARDRVMPMLRDVYGDAAAIWFQRWRMFYMAVAELFGYARGREWGVAHYLFEKRPIKVMP